MQMLYALVLLSMTPLRHAVEAPRIDLALIECWVPGSSPLTWMLPLAEGPAATGPEEVQAGAGLGTTDEMSNVSINPFPTDTLDPSIVIVSFDTVAFVITGCSGSIKKIIAGMQLKWSTFFLPFKLLINF